MKSTRPHTEPGSGAVLPLCAASIYALIGLAGCFGSEARPARSASLSTLTEPADGVWVHVYEDDNLAGRDCVLPGPAEYESLSNLCGRNRNGRISSLVVGPKAWVIAYHELNFEGHRRYYAPGRQVIDLAADESDNDFESIKVFSSRPAEWRDG